MKFNELERIVSPERVQRYLLSTDGNEELAVELYRANIRASLEMFAVVGVFEVALRNAINERMIERFGNDWLRDAIMPGGIFDIPQCRDHARIICTAYEKLVRQNQYSHAHLLAKMEFGIWKYMFSNPQYRATGRILLSVFPDKPTSTRTVQYNNSYIFNELDRVNSLRNRIAHHEPICFPTGFAVVDTSYIRTSYAKIKQLLTWMDINADDVLEGIEKVEARCSQINKLHDKINIQIR